jgi:arabinoxylan arabinofuranohydrolase
VKGKGKIEVYIYNLKGTPLVSLTCDENNWTTISKRIKRKIDKGVGNIYFVFEGENFAFDEWKFY